MDELKQRHGAGVPFGCFGYLNDFFLDFLIAQALCGYLLKDRKQRPRRRSKETAQQTITAMAKRGLSAEANRERGIKF